jgi:hypothetical protein
MAMGFSQHNQFKPIEITDFEKIFAVHSEEEGPGVDNFGVLYLRLHILKNSKPQATNFTDLKKISKFIGKNSKYNANDYTYKFIYRFKSNAPWKLDYAEVTFYINKILYDEYIKEIKVNDEYWLFLMIKEYSTFDMTGNGIVYDFMSKKAMLENKLIQE